MLLQLLCLSILKISKNLIILNILIEKLVISCILGSFYAIKIVWSFSNSTVQIAMISTMINPWLNFDLNFSFKLCYNFIGQLKKLPKLNLWWWWSKVLTNTVIFSTFHILVIILFFHDWDSSILNVKVL